MNNKEVLERIKRSHRIAMVCLGIDKPDIETEKAIEKIEKDLEVLEILKKHYDKDSLILSLGDFMTFHIYNDDKDFNKVKEWLENE